MSRRSTSHDQLFKDLLRHFFAQFIELVAPDLARELDLSKVRFLEQEVFSDLPEGQRSIADLVAEVQTLHGDPPRLILIHGEVEGVFRQATGLRVWRYSMGLVLKHRKDVISIVVYRRAGRGGVWRETLVRKVAGLETHAFTYYAFGLSKSQAADYLARPQELAWSLASLMDPGTMDRPGLKLACWQRLVHAKVDKARQFLLTNLVETYVKLNVEEQVIFEERLEALNEHEEVRTMQMTWAEEMELKGIEKGIQKGIEKGIQEGRLEGRREGRHEGMRVLLEQQIEQRFGRLPRSLRERLAQLDDTARLQRLSLQILEAKSLDDLDF